MKKLIVVFSAVLLMASAAFAKEKYHGDIQFHMGGNSLTTYIEKSGNKNTICEDKIDTKQICFDIATWHMWDLSKCFSMGFVFDIYGGFGSLDSWSAGCIKETFTNDVRNNSPITGGIFIGPAFGLQLGKIAKISLGIGAVSNVAVSYNNDYHEKSAYDKVEILSSAGIGADVQLKLLPSIFFSPVIGYRCSVGFGGKNNVCYKENEKCYRSSREESVFSIPVSGTLYAGFSFNW